MDRFASSPVFSIPVLLVLPMFCLLQLTSWASAAGERQSTFPASRSLEASSRPSLAEGAVALLHDAQKEGIIDALGGIILEEIKGVSPEAAAMVDLGLQVKSLVDAVDPNATKKAVDGVAGILSGNKSPNTQIPTVSTNLTQTILIDMRHTQYGAPWPRETIRWKNTPVAPILTLKNTPESNGANGKKGWLITAETSQPKFIFGRDGSAEAFLNRDPSPFARLYCPAYNWAEDLPKGLYPLRVILTDPSGKIYHHDRKTLEALDFIMVPDVSADSAAPAQPVKWNEVYSARPFQAEVEVGAAANWVFSVSVKGRLPWMRSEDLIDPSAPASVKRRLYAKMTIHVGDQKTLLYGPQRLFCAYTEVNLLYHYKLKVLMGQLPLQLHTNIYEKELIDYYLDYLFMPDTELNTQNATYPLDGSVNPVREFYKFWLKHTAEDERRKRMLRALQVLKNNKSVLTELKRTLDQKYVSLIGSGQNQIAFFDIAMYSDKDEPIHDEEDALLSYRVQVKIPPLYYLKQSVERQLIDFLLDTVEFVGQPSIEKAPMPSTTEAPQVNTKAKFNPSVFTGIGNGEGKLDRSKAQFLSCGAFDFGNMVLTDMKDFMMRVNKAYNTLKRNYEENIDVFSWRIPEYPIKPKLKIVRWSSLASYAGINLNPFQSMSSTFRTNDMRYQMPKFRLHVERDPVTSELDVFLFSHPDRQRVSAAAIFRTGYDPMDMAENIRAQAARLSEAEEEVNDGFSFLGLSSSNEPYMGLLPIKVDDVVHNVSDVFYPRRLEFGGNSSTLRPSKLYTELLVLDRTGKVVFGPVEMHCPYTTIQGHVLANVASSPLVFQVSLRTVEHGVLVDEFSRPINIKNFFFQEPPKLVPNVIPKLDQCGSYILGTRLLDVEYYEFVRSEQLREYLQGIFAGSLGLQRDKLTICEVEEGSTLIGFSVPNVQDHRIKWKQAVYGMDPVLKRLVQCDERFPTLFDRASNFNPLSAIPRISPTTTAAPTSISSSQADSIPEIDTDVQTTSIYIPPAAVRDDVPVREVIKPSSRSSVLEDENNKGIDAWTWALIGIGASVVFAIIVALVFFVRRKKKSGNNIHKDHFVSDNETVSYADMSSRVHDTAFT